MTTPPMRRAARALLALAAFVAVGCYTSTDPRRFAPAIGPRGVSGELSLSGKRIPVELLELTDSSYVVLTRKRVAVVPFGAVEAWRFSQVANWTYVPPRGSIRELLVSSSRFPYGTPPAALAELLAATGQQAPDTLRAGKAK